MFLDSGIRSYEVRAVVMRTTPRRNKIGTILFPAYDILVMRPKEAELCKKT